MADAPCPRCVAGECHRCLAPGKIECACYDRRHGGWPFICGDRARLVFPGKDIAGQVVEVVPVLHVPSVEPTRIDPASRRILTQDGRLQHVSYLLRGPDGMMYWTHNLLAFEDPRGR